MTYVLDASSLLRFLDDEAGAGRIEDLLNKARLGGNALLLSAIDWGVVVYILARAHGPEKARPVVDSLASLPLKIVSVDASHAEEAAWFKEQFKVPYADAFAGALARREKLTLVTADYDFKSVGTAIKVEFLPAK
ncbi:MAG TPA: PIN domain-containing protein [Terriglobales bacterium]|jgi:ribonuclease VapC